MRQASEASGKRHQKWPKLIIEGTNVKSQEQDRNRCDLRQCCGGTQIALARAQFFRPIEASDNRAAVISDPPLPGDALVQFSSPVYGDRAELRVAAVAGAVLGIVTGYSLGWFNMLIWALIGAVVVSGAVYCYRALR